MYDGKFCDRVYRFYLDFDFNGNRVPYLEYKILFVAVCYRHHSIGIVDTAVLRGRGFGYDHPRPAFG